MIYSIFVLSLTIVFILFSQKKYEFLMLTSLILILFVGMRYESGGDWYSYKKLYELNYVASTEYLYWFMSIIHKEIFNSFAIFIFMIASVTILIKLYVLDKITKNVVFAVFMFICLSYINIDIGLIRNSIAIAFFMLTVYYYDKGKHKFAYLYFLTAFFFHHSVLLMVFIFFIKNIKVSFLYYFVILSVLTVSMFEIMRVVVIYFSSMLENIPYVYYKLNHYLSHEAFQNSSLNIYTSRYALLSVVFLYYRNKIKEDYYIGIFIIGSCIMLLIGFNVQFYTRIGVYLTIYEIIIVTKFINLFKGRNKAIIYPVLIFFYLIIFFRTSYIHNIINLRMF